MAEPKISTQPIAEKKSSYRKWIESEGIALIEGFFIEDIKNVPLQPWERNGGSGVRICLEGTGETDDCYICEIPPGKNLKPQRHLFEEMIYIVSGRGATTIWNDGGPKRTFEWQEGSLFSPRLNTWHQHFNGSGDQPARYDRGHVGGRSGPRGAGQAAARAARHPGDLREGARPHDGLHLLGPLGVAVLAVHNDRGEEISREIAGVGALHPGESRTFRLWIEIFAAPTA